MSGPIIQSETVASLIITQDEVATGVVRLPPEAQVGDLVLITRPVGSYTQSPYSPNEGKVHGTKYEPET